MNLSTRLGTLGLALVLGGAAAAATSQNAAADVRIHFGGGWHGGGGVYVGPRVHVVRPYYRPYYRPWVSGHIWVGGYYYERPFAQPPPAQPPCDCGPNNAYYPPIAPAPSTAVYAAPTAVEEAPLPRFGIGAFLGGVSVEGNHEGEDVGLVGQFRLARPLVIEGEIAKNTLADGARVDRRLLIGANLEFGPARRFAPYVTAGIGTTQVQVTDGWEDNQAIAELGAGLRWRLSPRISLFGDFRFGSRQSMDGEKDPATLPPDTTARSVAPADHEGYTRLRLGGMLTF